MLRGRATGRNANHRFSCQDPAAVLLDLLRSCLLLCQHDLSDIADIPVSRYASFLARHPANERVLDTYPFPGSPKVGSIVEDNKRLLYALAVWQLVAHRRVRVGVGPAQASIKIHDLFERIVA